METPGGQTARLRLGMAAAAVAGLVAVAGVGAWTLEASCRAHAEAAAQAAVRAATETFHELVRTTTEELSATLGSLSRDRELTAALAARDARRILALAGPTFHDLRLRDRITYWSYWEPDAGGPPRGLRNVVRLGTPTLRGDVVERELLARVAREKAVVSGIELGVTALALRVVAPVRDRDRVVGYAELGRELATLFAEMKMRTGDDFALVLDKRRVDARRWASARAARGERDDWGDLPNLVVVRGPGVGAAVLPDALPPSDLPDGGAAIGVHQQEGRVFALGAFPIRDAAGVKVGAIYVFRDVTALAARERALRRRALGSLAAGVALASLAVVAVQGWILRPPRRRPGGEGATGPGGSVSPG